MAALVYTGSTSRPNIRSTRQSQVLCSSAIFSVVQEHKLHFHWFIHCMIPNIQEGDSRDVPIIRLAIQNTLYQLIFFIIISIDQYPYQIISRSDIMLILK